jgi:4-alpha-glucanotransferase
MTREVGVTMTGAVRTRPRPEEETMLEVLGDLEEHLGGGRAAIVLVDLADLCLETEPQNRPGTTEEEGNFSLRLQSPTAQILEQPEVRAILHRLARARAGRRARTGGVSS